MIEYKSKKRLMKNASSVVNNFESRVCQGLSECGASPDSLLHKGVVLGAAVSGGADSISLVTALHHILPEGVPLFVITVNHNIRPEAETAGDASFVESYCHSLGVSCCRIEIPRGKVGALAKERGMGVEEAARLLRYEAFESFCSEKHIAFLCLAHNRNDQIETVVMRFLRGSSALSGIPRSRQLFEGAQIIRPLLDIPREAIEEYLAAQQLSFRTDKTNFDTAMMRNCIRQKVMPLLDEEMPGWRTSVCTLAQKAHDDEAAIETLVEKALPLIEWRHTSATEKAGAVISFSDGAFAYLPPAVQRRIMYRAVTDVGADERVPYLLVETVCRLSRKRNGVEADCLQNDCTVLPKEKIRTEESAGIVVTVHDGRVFVQKKAKDATESGFFVIIKQIGEYEAGPYLIRVNRSEEGIVLSAERAWCLETDANVTPADTIILPKISFPFAVRSRQPGDEIVNADGSLRSVSSILDDAHVACGSNGVPLIQELQTASQRIICIWGQVCGFDNWIVKE